MELEVVWRILEVCLLFRPMCGTTAHLSSLTINSNHLSSEHFHPWIEHTNIKCPPTNFPLAMPNRNYHNTYTTADFLQWSQSSNDHNPPVCVSHQSSLCELYLSIFKTDHGLTHKQWDFLRGCHSLPTKPYRSPPRFSSIIGSGPGVVSAES